MNVKELGQYMIILSPLMLSSLTYAMHTTLYNLVALPLMESSSHVSIIFLIDLHNIVVPP